jgi:hypothetical protein
MNNRIISGLAGILLSFNVFSSGNLIEEPEPDLRYSLGIIYTSPSLIEYRELSEFVDSNDYEVTKANSRDSEKQIALANNPVYVGNNGVNTIFRGSGGCVKHKGRQYIVTNYHVIETANSELIDKIHYDIKKDIAFIPFDVISGDIDIEPQRCLQIARKNSYHNHFYGIGDMFYSWTGFKSVNPILNPFSNRKEHLFISMSFTDGDYPKWARGLSGSLVFNNKGEVTGLIKSMSTGDNHDYSDTLHLVSHDDLVSFARKLP